MCLEIYAVSSAIWTPSDLFWTWGQLELGEYPPAAITENWNWTPSKLIVCISYFHNVSAVWKYKQSPSPQKNNWFLIFLLKDLAYHNLLVKSATKIKTSFLGPFWDLKLTLWKSAFVLCCSSVECCPADTVWWQLICIPVYWTKGSGVSSATNTVKNIILTNLHSEALLIKWQHS